jgi:uncharacterized protein YeaO (DUF488 family)
LSNELKQLVKEIQFKTDKSLGEIAKEIGYSRAYFNNEVNKGENEALLKLLQERYGSEIEQTVLHGKIKAGHKVSKTAANIEDWLPYINQSNSNLIEQIEARRQDFQKWAELARSDKEKAEKEKDRLLTIIENNLTLLIKIVGSVDTNLKTAMEDLHEIEFGQRAQHTVMINSLERIEKKPGKLNKELSTLERAYLPKEEKAGKTEDVGK